MSMTPEDDRRAEELLTLSQLMDGEWHDIDRSACVAAACADDRLRAAWGRWHLVRDALRGEAVAPAPLALAERIGRCIAEEPAYSNVTPWPGASAAGPSAPGAVSVSGEAPGDAVPGPASGAPPAAPRRPWRLAAGGLALAASVALGTVVGLNAWRTGVPGGPDAAGGGAIAVGPAGPVGPVGASASAADDSPVPAALRVDAAFARRAPLARLPEVELVANTGGAGSYWVAGDGGARRGASERRLNAFLSQHIESSPTAARQGMLPYSRLVGYDDPAGAPAADGTANGTAGGAGAGADAGR